MKLSFNIARKFLFSNLSQTIIIILGIGVGISVQIFIGSLIQGLQKSLVEKTIGNSSQITITSKTDDKKINNYLDLEKTVLSSDKKIKYVLSALDNPALLDYNGKSQSLLVRGFDIKKADNIYNISKSIVEGAVPQKADEVILGVSLRDEIGLKLNQKINIITPDKRSSQLKVCGFFDLKVAQLNNSWCITTLNTAQSLFKIDDAVTSIETQLNQDDVFSADIISKKVEDNLNNKNLSVTNWKAQNQQLLSGLQGQTISSLMIQIFVMISVVLGIASVLAITVMQKSKQIGILKAMGIKNSTASLIFLFEGAILGFFGAFVGIGMGLGLATAFTTFALNADGTPVVALYINQNFILLSGIIAIVACLIASLIPAKKSSKLNPIDIIRNN